MKKYLAIGLAIVLTLLAGCGGSDATGNADGVSEIVQQYENGDQSIDFANAAAFEKALNDGEKVNGKIVQFDVVEYKPDSALGINCWSGEHLNFISDHELDVAAGDIIIGYVKSEPVKVWDSWKIPYEILEIQKNSDSEEINSSSESINSTDKDSQDIENVSDTEKVIDNTEIKEDEKATDEDEQKQDEEAAVEEKQDQDIEETTPAYTITDISTIMYVKSSANVRSKPSKDDEKLGTLSTNEEVSITGQVDNGWYRINYNGSDGYVSGDLLSAEKTVESVPDTNNNSREGTGDAGITAPVTQDVQGNLVWVPTHGGTKYHITSSCSGMKDPIQMTQEQAEASGYTPCKRCY